MPGRFPKTEAFFQRVQKDAATVTDESKDFYKRPRPYVLDPASPPANWKRALAIPAAIPRNPWCWRWCWQKFFPTKHDAIVAEARNIGWHRVEIARHYPTDIYAGRVLAQAIVRRMNKNDEFQRDLAAARAEVAAAQTAANN